MNPILLTDSYKTTHWKQYPPGTEKIYSYFESRGGEFKETVFFGLQYILKKYLSQPITRADIDEAQMLVRFHIGVDHFNLKGWLHILEKHDGFLPVSIRAVPEGTVSSVLTPLITVENTDPECFWLTNYLETLLVQTWYPTTVATLSREIKKTILQFLQETGTPEDIGIKLHDFGFRGASSVESAGLGGLAHLINFSGTDTLQALAVGRNYYWESTPGFSIPAAEHSTITSWGKENESDAFKNMVTQYGNGTAYAVVSDSYDIYKACESWGSELKEYVLAHKGVLVIRPDSGNPHDVLPKMLEILENGFGSIVNHKGFKVLPPQVRIIWGDGVDHLAIRDILDNTLKRLHWSADNIAFGMGGALLQKLNRDTLKFAFKCSSATVDGEERDVFKDPVTDHGKVSKRGRFAELPEVYRDGKLLIDQSFEQIRERASILGS